MSSSQLREGSCWFFATGREEETQALITPESIRCWMGDFSGIKNVAKYAARMGQCFSCTVTTGKMAVVEDEYKMIPDIKSACGRYTFSDGIGTISKEVKYCVSGCMYMWMCICVCPCLCLQEKNETYLVG